MKQTISGIELQLVEIPAGSFLMGSPESEEGRWKDEGPQHEVALESFFLGRTPVTQVQWREVAGWVEGPGERWGLDLSGRLVPSTFQGDNRPVERVNWFEAMEFCQRLSQRTGHHYTLPSEAQWEYACRAGTTNPFYFGENLNKRQANYDRYCRDGTTKVGRYPANAWGLHDMHGSVWEWCLDHWHDSYDKSDQKAPADGSPWLDPVEAAVNERDGKGRDERRRVLRGGCWSNIPEHCRSASRLNFHPAYAGNFIGFRVCCLP